MRSIAGLAAKADHHDHLVITINRGLGVVSLNPAAGAVEDVAVGVRKIPIRIGPGTATRIGGEQVDEHRLGACSAVRAGDSRPAPGCLERQLLASSCHLQEGRV